MAIEKTNIFDQNENLVKDWRAGIENVDKILLKKETLEKELKKNKSREIDWLTLAKRVKRTELMKWIRTLLIACIVSWLINLFAEWMQKLFFTHEKIFSNFVLRHFPPLLKKTVSYLSQFFSKVMFSEAVSVLVCTIFTACIVVVVHGGINRLNRKNAKNRKLSFDIAEILTDEGERYRQRRLKKTIQRNKLK